MKKGGRPTRDQTGVAPRDRYEKSCRKTQREFISKGLIMEGGRVEKRKEVRRAGGNENAGNALEEGGKKGKGE